MHASHFNGNAAGFGGAVYATSTTLSDHTIAFEQQCTFEDCTAVSGGGGAVAVQGWAGLLLVLNDTDMSFNTGLEGGAVLTGPLAVGYQGPSAVLSHVSAVGNSVTSPEQYHAGGGAILVYDAPLVIKHCDMQHNSAPNACGGGVAAIVRYKVGGYATAVWGNGWPFNLGVADVKLARAGLYMAWSTLIRNRALGGGAMCVGACCAPVQCMRRRRSHRMLLIALHVAAISGVHARHRAPVG